MRTIHTTENPKLIAPAKVAPQARMHRLDLELTIETPSLHMPPPASLSHLNWVSVKPGAGHTSILRRGLPPHYSSTLTLLQRPRHNPARAGCRVATSCTVALQACNALLRVALLARATRSYFVVPLALAALLVFVHDTTQGASSTTKPTVSRAKPQMHDAAVAVA